MKSASWLLLGMVGGVLVVKAQVAPPPVAPRPAGWLLLPDKPYVAVEEYDREQKTTDGRNLTQHETHKLWRDSAGRVRREVARDKERVVWTYLTDPAAKVQYRWNNEAKVAYVTRLGEPIPPRPVTNPLQPGEVRDTASTINGKRLRGTVSLLPAKTIEKQETLATHLILYSDVARNDVYETLDRWYQPDYHLTLQESLTDQQYGHRTWRMRSFKTEEPKADLFQVPKGFTLKQEETPESEQFE